MLCNRYLIILEKKSPTALAIAIGATVIYEGEKATSVAIAVTVVAFSCGFFTAEHPQYSVIQKVVSMC